MRRSRLAAIVGVVPILFAAPLTVDAQPAKIPTVAFLGAAPTDDDCKPEGNRAVQAFRQGLRDLGYVLDRTIVAERHCYSTAEQLTKVVGEVIARKVDVIVAAASDAAVAVHRATQTIPTVIVHTDPVHAGLVKSLARPGGNITGMSMYAEVLEKRIELLRTAAPSVSRVAVLADPGFAPRARADAHAAGRGLGLHVRTFDVRNSAELHAAFDAMQRDRLDGVVAHGGRVLFASRKLLIEWVAEHRIPAMFWWQTFTDEGGLMSYAVDLTDHYRRLAGYVDKILKGARPADLPVQQPTKFEFVINMRTAKALGLTIAPSLLLRADRIIE